MSSPSLKSDTVKGMRFNHMGKTADGKTSQKDQGLGLGQGRLVCVVLFTKVPFH